MEPSSRELNLLETDYLETVNATEIANHNGFALLEDSNDIVSTESDEEYTPTLEDSNQEKVTEYENQSHSEQITMPPELVDTKLSPVCDIKSFSDSLRTLSLKNPPEWFYKMTDEEFLSFAKKTISF